MKKYRKKPVVIEAVQWFRNGDHPEDNCGVFQRPTGPDGEMLDYPGEGKVVRYFRCPDIQGDTICAKCEHRMHDHGWIDTFEGGHVVCPGDYIITGIQGEKYPCKPDIFEETYEEVK